MNVELLIRSGALLPVSLPWYHNNVLMCYFQLTAEYYRWWSSLVRGAACGVFKYAYTIIYWLYTAHSSAY